MRSWGKQNLPLSSNQFEDFKVVTDQSLYRRYVVIRGLLNSEELSKLKHALENSEDIKKHAYGRNDSQGRVSKLCLWNYAGNDICGVMAR